MSWISEAFDRAVENNRARVAVVEEDRKWTFGELGAEVDSIARTLRSRVPGDTVGILLLNLTIVSDASSRQTDRFLPLISSLAESIRPAHEMVETLLSRDRDVVHP